MDNFDKDIAMYVKKKYFLEKKAWNPITALLALPMVDTALIKIPSFLFAAGAVPGGLAYLLNREVKTRQMLDKNRNRKLDLAISKALEG